nr:AP2-like factor, ANT lineage [Ipomoea batatas]
MKRIYGITAVEERAKQEKGVKCIWVGMIRKIRQHEHMIWQLSSTGDPLPPPIFLLRIIAKSWRI